MVPQVRRRFRASLFVVLLLLSGRLPAGDDGWFHGVYAGRSPRPVVLASLEAWRQACDCALHNRAAFVLEGGGESMLPLYPPGTILVLQNVPFAKLQPGQTALYRNHENRTVAHVLVAKALDGWRVTGLNNPTHDMEPVNTGNFVGIVIAAFLPLPARRAQLASQ